MNNQKICGALLRSAILVCMLNPVLTQHWCVTAAPLPTTRTHAVRQPGASETDMLPASQLACDSPWTVVVLQADGLTHRCTSRLVHGFPAALRHRALTSRRRHGLFCQRTPFPAERSCRSVNILRREGAGSGEKHLIFQSTAQIDLCCFFLPSERLPVFVACSLCRSPRILDAPVHPTPPAPLPS